MNVIYNSEHYSVVEFGAQSSPSAMEFGGYEILDKPARKEIFIAGPLAEVFRQNVMELIATEKTQARIEHMLKNGKPLRN